MLCFKGPQLYPDPWIWFASFISKRSYAAEVWL